jgi:hypothetical protein
MGTDVSTELAVMQAVGNALAQLPDNDSRVRVLRWATDRLQRSEAALRLATPARPAAPAWPPARGPQAADPIVSIEGLAELFPNLGVHIRQNRQDDTLTLIDGANQDQEEAEPLEALIRTLAEDLGQFAIAWQHA